MTLRRERHTRSAAWKAYGRLSVHSPAPDLHTQPTRVTRRPARRQALREPAAAAIGNDREHAGVQNIVQAYSTQPMCHAGPNGIDARFAEHAPQHAHALPAPLWRSLAVAHRLTC